MLGFFPKSTVAIPDFPDEQWSITRAGRGKTTSHINSQYQALIPKNTKATKGTVVTIVNPDTLIPEKYFVTTLERSFVNTVAKLYLANCEINIVELKKHMITNASGVSVSDYIYESLIVPNVPSYYEEITAKMQQYDLGLLAKSTKKFLVSDDIPLKNLDRIKINGENAQVDGIAKASFPGLLWVQCSNDTRPYKVI